MAKLFGFVQFDFAGTLPLADGRYLAGSPGSGEETVLVLQRLGAPVQAERRRRRGRSTPADPEPPSLTLTRATVIRAASPFGDPAEAARWLDESCETDGAADLLVGEAIKTLNRALHAQAVAAADPYGRQVSPEQAERMLIGHGSGEETADGRFTDAREVGFAPRAGSRRREREEQLRPQERVAAVLRGREHLDACETLLLRARVDLDAGRTREAALQLRIGLEALLAELKGALTESGHEQDVNILTSGRGEVNGMADTALYGDLNDQQRQQAEELLRVCERVLRRRQVLGGSSRDTH